MTLDRLAIALDTLTLAIRDRYEYLKKVLFHGFFKPSTNHFAAAVADGSRHN